MWFLGVFRVWNHPRSQWNGEITGEYEYWPTTACVCRLSSSWPRRHEHISHELWPKPGKIGIYHSCQLMSTRIGWPWICIIWGFKRLTLRIHQPGLIYLGFWMWKLPSSLQVLSCAVQLLGQERDDLKNYLVPCLPEETSNAFFLLFGSIFAGCPTVVFPCFGYQGGFPCNSLKSNRWTRWWFWCRCLGPRGSKTQRAGHPMYI